ncbi:UbiH/UbiF family hydroxylase [Rhizobiaceae bacterium n13]|uniref:UbiH/UbiF family hydroxylase n=1 Tax=Ferirhizobium litorale TaxID=2927786 RepID=A0AAE3QDN3_9HYPH|nr:UbiH/UbiF family hydroxylase [Fererhizobium litorale]MDI7863209.1 UbiH/UbiF family hydroxylase [Fererhizobium litorale]MDI7923056.1 UbiH/UbiF family hydroxylase [Fererhizobium litorale]
MEKYEIAIIGGGMAGMITALSLAKAGRSVVLIAGPARKDRRTTALMDQSIRFLDSLGVWEKMRPSAAALSTMQIIDGTSRLLRAPTVAFRSAELGLEAFGHNFPNEALIGVLEDMIAGEDRITVVAGNADSIAISEEGGSIRLQNGAALEASFVVGADGRRSMVRESAGITVRTWSYPQTALVLNFSHSIPHHDISTEIHTETGPFTQVPLPGDRSSLVWVQKPENAARMAELPLEDISRMVETRMQSMLGKVSVDAGPQTWPLSGMVASRFGAGRVALVGEAAHAFPPIGAQGLNLSLRDIIVLTEILSANPGVPISRTAGDSFDRRRRADVMTRTASVDLLNRSLLSNLIPVQMLRAAGLHLLSSLSPLRSLVMHEGIEPGGGLKSIPEGLREKVRRQGS